MMKLLNNPIIVVISPNTPNLNDIQIVYKNSRLELYTS